MTREELKQLIREAMEEATTDYVALSKQGMDVIEFLADNEDAIASSESERQDLRRVRGYITSILTDEDYKRLHPTSGGDHREDFAKGT